MVMRRAYSRPCLPNATEPPLMRRAHSRPCLKPAAEMPPPEVRRSYSRPWLEPAAEEVRWLSATQGRTALTGGGGTWAVASLHNAVPCPQGVAVSNVFLALFAAFVVGSDLL